MADSKPDSESIEGSPLGDELSRLLAALRRAELKIGPREHLAAHTLATELIARGHIVQLSDMRQSLRPLLARSATEGEAFDVVFDAIAMVTSPLPQGSPPEPKRRYDLRFPAAALLIFVAGVLAFHIWFRLETNGPFKTEQPREVRQAFAPVTVVEEPPVTNIEVLNRIANAAACFGGAPTLEELSGDLARISDTDPLAAPWCLREESKPVKGIGWSAASYAIKLHEWSGLPLSVPIGIYGSTSRNGSNWARLALALARIEHPGTEPSFAELLAAANANLPTADKTPLTYKIAEALIPPPQEVNAPQSKTDLISVIQSLAAQKHLGGPVSTTVAVDPFYVRRALAISGVKLPAGFQKDAPWLANHPLMEVSYAPRWAPLISFMFPLAFALFWFANSLALRKAYLRRRPPKLPPLHMDIVSEVRRGVTGHQGQLRRLAQRLLVRTSEITDQIDVSATICATITTGFITPAYSRILRTPEYLVLIERRAMADQEAERMRTLIRRLRDVIPLTIYTFQGDPALLEPERSVRPVPIEQVIAAHSNHRLIVLGSGEGFLDPVYLLPRAAAQKLTQFYHRALLTPIPVAEWGREEFALAQELQLPIGRATIEGMERLSELLGLERTAGGNLIHPQGDGLARVLPEMLRVHPDRFFYSAPPSGVEVPQLLRELRNFLDGPGFEWLCALAVYPAVQWDLTLYLGVTLAEKRNDDPATPPIYREDRIAALTQLPWLREGAMPVWLRRALIAELGHAGRAGEVRDALKRLIEEAKQKGERRNESDVILRIAREQPMEGFDPERLYDDEVLLDFMARGRVEDFALPRRTWLESILPRGLLDRIGVPGLVAGMIALVYAAAAWWITPKTDGLPWGLSKEARLPTVPGAWLPLELLTLSGLMALALANPSGTRKLLGALILQVPALALAFAALMLTFAIWPSIPLLKYGWAEATTLALAAAYLLIPRYLLSHFFIIRAPRQTSALRSVVNILVSALTISFLAWIFWALATP